jgi:TP901 family phage tail tape measure protein
MKFVIPAVFTAVDKFTGPLSKMQGSASQFANKLDRDFRNAGSKAFAIGRSAGAVGLAITAPLGLAVKQAVDFEDAMADVGKTTQLSGAPLKALGDSILSLSNTTRTSIDDLVKISEIGGQLGIASKDLVGFTSAADKFNIALGADFAGGVEEAVSQVGKIKALFSDTRNMNIADAIMKSGSAINELGAVGAGTSANITDFTLRLGALPDALKPSIQNTLAMGTFLEELGINAQIGAGGMTNLLLVAGERINGFASQMKMSGVEAKTLLKQDPTEFAKRFASTFKGMAPEIMANKLKELGLGSQETIKVIGALGSATERLTELQKVSSDSFAKGTSLTTEAAKKNNTMAAKMAMLRNNVKSLSITLGNALLPVINDVVESVMPFVKGISNWINNNRELAGTVVKIVAGLGAFAIAVSAVSFAIGLYQKAAVIASAATRVFNLLISMNPLGAFLLTLGAVAFAVYKVVDAFSGLSVAEQVNNDIKQRALEKTVDQRVEVIQLFNALRNTKAGTEAYTETLKKIDAMSPGLVQKYNLQAGALRNINAAEKELTKSIMDRATAEAEAELLKESIKKGVQLKDELAQGPGLMDYVLYGPTAGIMKKKEIIENQQRTGVLANKVARREMNAANPDKARSENISKSITEKTEKQKLEISFSGLPDGVKANMTTPGNKMQPRMSSTMRK